MCMSIPATTAQKALATIFAGFLGSGKTTIISHLIEQLQNEGTQVVYIKNEIGDTDLDAQLMKTKNVHAKELLNGCICCTLVGGFSESITEVISAYQPDRIIIEASGDADPSALALMVSAHPLLTRDGVVGVIDVVNFEGFRELTPTAKEQTKFIDLLLFNKVELVDEKEKLKVVGYVRELNEHSPIIETKQGHVDPELIFGCSSQELEQLLKDKSVDEHHHPSQQFLSAVTVNLPDKLTREGLQQWIETTPNQVFRTKGIFVDEHDSPVLFNSVNKRVTFQELEKKEYAKSNFCICIGYKLDTLTLSI